ncbi:hypothetical protein [Streptomyces sp. NBC_00259]|uniref:hypothetical protein n=1 Tax=Streptomyces sp. NBC_00259 TaxID=2903643 RepID=UPI002E2DC5B1|nr:hypothetical protein [Streptomyces sp. NBC_00259]
MSSTERPQNSADGPEGSPRRLRRSPLAVASVAAAVLVAGGGGAYLATTASDGGAGAVPGADDKPPPLALDGGTGVAAGEPSPYGVEYRAAGELPDGPDSAPLYEANGTVGEAEVKRLAEALGVPGTPRLHGDVWKAGGEKDGGGPQLQVNRQAPGTWSFARFGLPKGDDCVKKDVCRPGGGILPQAPETDGVRTVSEEAAKKAAAPVLAAVGQSDAGLDATQVMGSVRVVRADPVVGGLPTYGWSTGVHVGADGTVSGGSGQLAKPVKGPEYPVIGAERTLKQLNESRRGGRVDIGGCATPGPLTGQEKPAAPEPAAPCEPKGTTGPDEVMTITKAEFGLAVHSVAGRPALVPSWLFEVKPTRGAQPFTMTEPAVAPAYLKQAPKEPAAPPVTQEPARPPGTSVPSPGDPSKLPETTVRGVESYAVAKDGRTLTLRFWGGVCSDYSAAADETGTEVKVKIIESRPDPGRVCILIAKELTAKVTLDKPLGGRTVLDVESGDAVPRK